MDKQVTRWANMGATKVLFFGQWWPLTKGTYRIDAKNRKVVRVEA